MKMIDYWSSHLRLDKKNLIEHIKHHARNINRNVTLMEVCGGHTNTIMKYGMRSIMPENVTLVSGPGCPVCVTSQRDIDSVIELALNGIPVATYGDMLRVPGTKMSLDQARENGAVIETVYSTPEVLELQKKHPSIIFLGIGFETTAPMTAFLLERNVPVYSTHKKIVPAMQALLGNSKIDGFILPGHVTSVTGYKQYEELDVAQAVCGFEAEHLLRGIYALVRMISEGKSKIVNTYPEAVSYEGNQKAADLINKNFRVTDAEWRGLGKIPASGFEVSNPGLDAKKIYSHLIKDIEISESKGCICGEILQGRKNPYDCPLFGRQCNPDNPLGACMVSSEGSCQIYFNN